MLLAVAALLSLLATALSSLRSRAPSVLAAPWTRCSDLPSVRALLCGRSAHATLEPSPPASLQRTPPEGSSTPCLAFTPSTLSALGLAKPPSSLPSSPRATCCYSLSLHRASPTAKVRAEEWNAEEEEEEAPSGRKARARVRLGQSRPCPRVGLLSSASLCRFSPSAGACGLPSRPSSSTARATHARTRLGSNTARRGSNSRGSYT